jgi:hypothetical protein
MKLKVKYLGIQSPMNVAVWYRFYHLKVNAGYHYEIRYGTGSINRDDLVTFKIDNNVSVLS